jgi:hypothetical protein
MKIILNKTKTINGNLYKLSLINEDFYFYSNYQEGDENGNTLMYDRQTDKLLSDNYFAYTALEDYLEKENYLWVSRYLKNCYTKYIKENKQ